MRLVDARTCDCPLCKPPQAPPEAESIGTLVVAVLVLAAAWVCGFLVAMLVLR